MSTPEFKVLSADVLEQIISEALDVLEKVGFYVENDEALSLLGDNGMRIDKKKRRVYCPGGKLEELISQSPGSIAFYNREAHSAFVLGDDNVVYTPGSAALNLLDHGSMKIRSAQTQDGKVFHKLVQNLKFIRAQSTALIYGDVPHEIVDSYRLYLALLYCSKPIVTGTFRKESLSVMKDLLVAVRGTEKSLQDKPLAIFDACPSPPLKWSDLTAQSLIDCARLGIPSEIISMPIAGATAPVTLKDALVQHTAENVSGILIAQAASPGAPVIYGGSPSILDMSQGTTPMGAVETMLLCCAFSQVGKYFNLPTHAYMGLSDAKLADYQAGAESAIGIILASLSGINMVAGAGMLNFESCQSFEKLVLDNELCGMADRFHMGISAGGETAAVDLINMILSTEDALGNPHTLEWFRKELFFPGKTIDRSALKSKEIKSGMGAIDRAAHCISEIIDQTKDEIETDLKQQLYKIMENEAKRWNFNLKDV